MARVVRGRWERYYMRAKVPDWGKEDIRVVDAEANVAAATDTPWTSTASPSASPPPRTS